MCMRRVAGRKGMGLDLCPRLKGHFGERVGVLQDGCGFGIWFALSAGRLEEKGGAWR